MGFLSGLLRPASSGADGFLAALRDKVERDRLRAAQAVARVDPAAAMEIRARSAAIDAQRAAAKERARRARISGQEDVHRRGIEEETGAGTADREWAGPGSGFRAGRDLVPDPHGYGWDPGLGNRLEADDPDPSPGPPLQLAAFQAGLPAFPEGNGRGPEIGSNGGAVGRALLDAAVASGAKPRIRVEDTPAEPPAWRTGGRWNATDIAPRVARAMRLHDTLVAQGMSPQEAAGWAANAEAESESDHRRQQPGGQGYGLFQWGRDRQRDFLSAFGHPIQQSTEDEQLRFRRHELLNREQAAARHIASAKSAGDYAAAITNHYERPNPKNRARDADDRANLAEAILAAARARDRRRRR
jgi:hypothetical protein